ncbi:MAG: DUF3080 family protein [Luminiphilus sp.]|nr:DUF3080 family protein [Luminiphilus sp.]
MHNRNPFYGQLGLTGSLTDSALSLRLKSVFVLWLASLLMACADQELGANKLDNYIARLSNTAEIDIVESAPVARILAPQLLETSSSEPADSLSLIDFLSLSGCELQVNIARRNTSMGRTASPSQRLILDLEFLRLAPACIELLDAEDDADIADVLRQQSDARLAFLKQRIFTAILDGPEWRDFWEQPATLGRYPETASGDAAQSLWVLSQRVLRFSNRTWSAEDEDIEPLLASIRANAGGQLLTAALLQASALDQANHILNAAYEQGRYCQNGKRTDVGTISKTIVTKFFAADIQAWSAQVSQRHYEIQTALSALESALTDVAPAAYRSWMEKRDAVLQQLYTGPREHVHTVQRALDNC